MYPGLQAKIRPDQPAIVMARSGETITYRELDERSNRLAHLLRAARLERGDHYSVFMENPSALCRVRRRGRARRTLLHKY